MQKALSIFTFMKYDSDGDNKCKQNFGRKTQTLAS